MIPETFEFIAELTSTAHALGMEVLVEIHSHYEQQLEIARQVDWVYDFALPPLVLHSLFAKDATALAHWLSIRPQNCVTVLDTHDGIGVIDVGAGGDREPGLLAPNDIDLLVQNIHERSNSQSRIATGAAANNLDLYQVNCTFFDALGRRDSDYLTARAIQLFVPGIPQIYYVGLLAGTNDMELLARTKVGRDINRHYYTPSEIEASFSTALVQNQIELIRLRNSHPAFGGQAQVELPDNQHLVITWKNSAHWAKLEVDLNEPYAMITCSSAAQQRTQAQWDSRASALAPKAIA